MKKILATILVVVMLLAALPMSAFASTAPTFEVGTVSGGVGKTVEVDVTVKNNPGIAGAILSIGYDSEVLKLVSVEQADFKGTFSPSPVENNPIKVVWTDLNENSKDGVFAKLHFTIKEGVAIGKVTEITVDYNPEDVFDGNIENVTFAKKNGSVTVICPHEYDNDADTECNLCKAKAYPGGNTLVQESGIWYHIVNREKVTDTTLVEYNGVWYYVKDGKVDFTATTLVSYNNKMWYVKAGKMARDNTIVKYNDEWYHVNNGTTVIDTTLVEYNGVLYYVKDGKVDFTVSALVEHNGAKYHVVEGKVDNNAHVYDKQITNSTYLKSAANCTSAAVYYKSCECGAKGTATFESGNALGHKYDNDADTECNTCKAKAYPGGNTLVNENGIWYHVVNRQKVTDTTLVQYGGVWYYVKDGKVDFTATTLVSYNNKMWYVKAGKMARDNTLVKYNNEWYHVNGGNTVNDTTLVQYSGTWYYVKDGKVDFTANTIVQYNGAKYHVVAGKVNFNAHAYDKQIANSTYLKSAANCTSAAVYYKSCECGAKGTATFVSGEAVGHKYDNDCDSTCNVCKKTRTVSGHKYDNNADTTCNNCGAVAYPGGNTLVQEKGVWYHVVNRQKVNDTTLVQYNGVWYYVKNGKVDFTATTLVSYNNKMWYVKAGKMARDNTLVNYNNVWYHVNGGTTVVDTTLVQYNGVWYYVKDGKVDFTATTLVSYNNKMWYVKAGKMARDNTLVKYNNEWYHVNGGTTTTSTTLVQYGGTWYYVKDGKVDFTATTLVSYNNKMWYVKAGKMARDNTLVKYNNEWYHVNGGTTTTSTTLVKYNGTWYCVRNGKVDFSYTGKILYNGKYYNVKNGVKV